MQPEPKLPVEYANGDALRYACRLCGNIDRAEDIVQTAAIRSMTEGLPWKSAVRFVWKDSAKSYSRQRKHVEAYAAETPDIVREYRRVDDSANIMAERILNVGGDFAQTLMGCNGVVSQTAKRLGVSDYYVVQQIAELRDALQNS